MLRTIGSVVLMVLGVFFVLAWVVSPRGGAFLLPAIVFLIASAFLFFAFRGRARG